MEDDFNMQMLDLMDQLNKIRRFRDAKGINPGDKDRYGFSYESFDAFSTDPLNFNETGMRLQTEAFQTFSMMRYLNRQSPLYIQISKQMVKLVSLLGSCCITKAVLEQQGCDFSFLECMSIQTLREMTAFNFRKVTSAYTTGITLYKYRDEMLDLSIRWAALDLRLKATQEKIDKIRSGEIKVDLKTKNEAPASRENQAPEGNTEEREKDPVPFSPQGRALPIDKAAVREFEQQQSEKQPAEAADTVPVVSSETPEETSETPAEASETTEEAEKNDPYLNEDDSDGDRWDGPYLSEEFMRRLEEAFTPT